MYVYRYIKYVHFIMYGLFKKHYEDIFGEREIMESERAQGQMYGPYFGQLKRGQKRAFKIIHKSQ